MRSSRSDRSLVVVSTWSLLFREEDDRCEGFGLLDLDERLENMEFSPKRPMFGGGGFGFIRYIKELLFMVAGRIVLSYSVKSFDTM